MNYKRMWELFKDNLENMERNGNNLQQTLAYTFLEQMNELELKEERNNYGDDIE
jgi:hypothetical protein